MPDIQQRHDRARVLVLDTAPGIWGAQNYLLRMVGPLAGNGLDLILAAPDGLELAEQWRARGLPCHEIALPRERSVRLDDGNDARVSARASAREAAALVRNVRVIRRAAREVGAELIWANGHTVHLDGALAGRLAGIPVVLHLHEEMPQAFGRLVRAAAVALSNRSVAVSEAIVTALPRPLARRAQVIGNGVDVELFRPAVPDPQVRASLGAAPADTLVLALTRLDPKKRIEDLIEAAAYLPDEPPWVLAIVGTTSAFPDYAARVRALAVDRLGDRVTFAGRREDVVDVLNAADVVAHAGVVEGTPLCLLEAQACGKAVVAYGTAGVSESVVDGVTGLLAPPRDVAGLAGRLGALVGDAEQRATMGRAARAHAVARDGIEAQIGRNAELLSTVLGRPMRAPTAPPRVLVVNHWHDDNRGDSAITQGIVALVRQVAPDARVTVTTMTEPGELSRGGSRHLERSCPGVEVRPSPFPTELRGQAGNRSRAVIALDAAGWLSRVLWPAARTAWDDRVAGADVVVLVGGSNIFDDARVPAALSLARLVQVLSPARAAVRLGRPVLLLGHTLGPLDRPVARALAARMLRGVTRTVVRDSTSSAVAAQLGLTMFEEAPDLAFAIVPERTAAVQALVRSLPAPPRRTLVLSVRQHPTLGRAADDRTVEVFASAARELVAGGHVDAVAVVPHTIGPTPIEDDRPMSARLARALGDHPVILVDADLSPGELCAFYAEVAAVVAVRLHASILALIGGTPTFAISYFTPKTEGVMAQVGLPDAVGDFTTVTPAQITAQIAAQLDDPTLGGRLERAAVQRRTELEARAADWFAALKMATATAGRD